MTETKAEPGDARMTTMTAVAASDPRMLAWEQYKQTPEFTNTKRWAVHPEHIEGSLWAAFVEGFVAAHLAEGPGLRAQIDQLANFIMAHVPGEPSRNEGAVECAIRLMSVILVAPKASTPKAEVGDDVMEACDAVQRILDLHVELVEKGVTELDEDEAEDDRAHRKHVATIIAAAREAQGLREKNERLTEQLDAAHATLKLANQALDAARDQHLGLRDQLAASERERAAIYAEAQRIVDGVGNEGAFVVKLARRASSTGEHGEGDHDG